jgi:Tol biopolymer transport system component
VGRMMSLRTALSFGAAAGLVFSMPTGAKASVELVDRASGAEGAKANAESQTPSISADGRLVAFASHATNLVDDDADTTLDVFVRDRTSDTTVLVSRATGPNGGKGEAASFLPSISADGRFVAFKSFASNLTADGAEDGIYVRDLQTDTTVLVSRANGPLGEPGLGVHGRPALSHDGRFVVFSSTAPNLSPEAQSVEERVYRRDLASGGTELISRGGQGGPPCSGSSPSISANGSVISFSSSSSCGARRADNPFSAVFVRKPDQETLELVSRSPGKRDKPFQTDVVGSSVSRTGRYVALSPGVVFVRDLERDRTKLAADLASTADRPRTSGEEALDGDGDMVTFSSYRAGRRQRSRLYVARWRTGRVEKVPGAVGAAGTRESLTPEVTNDGSLLSFQSTAPNLTADDPDDIRNVFVAEIPD